jgi:cobalt/nickel transport system permease protein
MHIPDGYLSPATAGTLYAAAAPFWYFAARKTKQMLSGRLVPLMALLSAFCFVIQMLNVPLPGGTTGHAVGASLAAIILTPWPAVIAVSIALIIQSLFFGDGGITAIGANCFNMAILQVFTSYAIYKMIPTSSAGGRRFAAAIAAYLAVNISGLAAAIQLGLQPVIAHAPDGTPLYAPYPLSVTIPAIVGAHLLAGFIEAMITVGTLAFIERSAPELLSVTGDPEAPLPRFWARMRFAWIVLAFLVILTPLGLLAPGTAWGEWSAEQLRDAGLGFIPQGMHRWETFWKAAFADYSVPGLGEQTGYAASAIVGIALILIVTYLLTFLGKRQTH